MLWAHYMQNTDHAKRSRRNLSPEGVSFLTIHCPLFTVHCFSRGDSPRTRPQRSRRQRAGSHTEMWRQRRGNRAEKIAAARAAAVAGDMIHGIRAEPMAARFAKWIDALNGEARQVLHARSLVGRQLCSNTGGACGGRSPGGPKQNTAGILRRMPLGVKQKPLLHLVLGLLCGFCPSPAARAFRSRCTKPAPFRQRRTRAFMLGLGLCLYTFPRHRLSL
jgi:hypothetical protein